MVFGFLIENYKFVTPRPHILKFLIEKDNLFKNTIFYYKFPCIFMKKKKKKKKNLFFLILSSKDPLFGVKSHFSPKDPSFKL